MGNGSSSDGGASGSDSSSGGNSGNSGYGDKDSAPSMTCSGSPGSDNFTCTDSNGFTTTCDSGGKCTSSFNPPGK